jgi:hypothetical protein
MISANHFIFRSDRTMLAAREDPGEAGLWVRDGSRQSRPEPANWDKSEEAFWRGGYRTLESEC